jgi:acetyl-CoA carboxylase, biotin carboxylase subunit
MFKKVLIANRGEIAVRIIRACRELDIVPVAVFSDVDRASLHVRMADEAYPVGPAPSMESYLVVEKILGVARYAGCDAIHPGYGFLAENPALPRACREAGVTFIGPSAEAMEKLGSKTAARHIARNTGTPTVAGTLDPIKDIGELTEIARKIGFPIVLKAVAGGGGKGMRVVERESDLSAAWRDAASEARNAFGDEHVYLEKYLERPRHIEIQIMADHHGHTAYLGERECSVQRRHQKVIEEAPSAVMTPDLRQAMGEAAVKLARAGNYTNAGTVEFLVDSHGKFYFLEMNTRLQVEHPVTEMVTSQDLVKLQMRIAAGEELPFTQNDVEIRGHAIECRIYAEDPDNNFFPSPGKILDRTAPAGPGIRVDEGIYSGWTVPNEYDPMLGKLIAGGRDRSEAIARLRRALDEYHAAGIKTNISLFRQILASEDFQKAQIYTRWLDDFLAARKASGIPKTTGMQDEERTEQAVAIAAALWHASHAADPAVQSVGTGQPASSPWRTDARREQVSREPVR